MSYVNYKLILLVIVILIFLIFLLRLFVKKVKHGWRYLVFGILILFLGILIQNRIAYLPFYHFNKEMCEEHPEIEKVTLYLSHGGQICRISVFLLEEVDDKTVENIFIDLMKGVNEEPVSSYLRETAGYERLMVQFFFMGEGNQRFYSEQYLRSEWFTKDNQNVQTWRNADTGKLYHYIDYME